MNKGQGGIHKQNTWGGFIVEFSLAVTGRGEQEGELVAGTTLITLVHRITQVGSYSLFVGMLT